MGHKYRIVLEIARFSVNKSLYTPGTVRDRNIDTTVDYSKIARHLLKHVVSDDLGWPVKVVLAFLSCRSPKSTMYFRALYDYFSGCSFLSVISSLLNFSGYCIITLVVSIILCQYQFAQFTIFLDIVYRLDIVYLQCDCPCFFIKGYLTWLEDYYVSLNVIPAIALVC